jgi:hypothetical protein
MAQDEENYFNDDFEHGYTTGVEQVDKTTYEGYLSSHVSYEWLQKRIEEKRTEVEKIDAEISETKQKRKSAFDKLQEFVSGESVASKNVGYVQDKIDALKAKINLLEIRRNKTESPYSLLAGVLYLLAGAAFIAGDLIISHEIVAYALNIRDNFEAWAFAVGLAMLSVLLKPAYERLVEQPYLTDYNAKTKRVYAIFQGFLLAFAVGTMLILGWFRYEAYRTDKLKEGINKQIKTLQINAQPLDATAAQSVDNQAIIKQMDDQMKAYDKLNLELVNSPWALASFVLSGVLFALAGAICLGIAFPILQSYWYRWFQVGPSLRRLQKQGLKLTEEIQSVEKLLAEQSTQKNVLQHDLELLPNLEELKTEKKVLLEEISKYFEDSKLADQDRRIHTFNDGVAKGDANRGEMTEDEYEEFRSTSVRQMKNAQDARPESSPKVYRNNGLRPHQALRKAITEQFNQN